MDRVKAVEYNAQGLELEEEGKVTQAITAYKRAIKADPTFSYPYFNLGLIYKYKNKWKESFIYNQKAVEADPKNEGALWNLGIAATALHKWNIAAQIWSKLGLKNPIKKAPLLYKDLGLIPVRLKNNGEVVWCDRLDPARAMINNIPTLDSKRSFEDIVLIDGAPEGYRVVEGQKIPVFNELELFKASGNKTSIIKIIVSSEEKLRNLYNMLDKIKSIRYEDWTTSLRMLCHECSIDTPPEFTSNSSDSFITKRTIALTSKNMESIKNIVKKISNHL
ncbi:MAG TPA: tetratricopeptide repeat protein [Candidatus Nitrosocosmicus sp.]|nr:tetratricopeptide repeat protein [Candidatus Nitrosocosmicus sp.]